MLKIWEPAPMSNNRELPFLYKIKLRFANEHEARKVLDHYLYHQEIMRHVGPDADSQMAAYSHVASV